MVLRNVKSSMVSFFCVYFFCNSSALAFISYEELDSIFRAFEIRYRSLFLQRNETLNFNFSQTDSRQWWNMETIHASFGHYIPSDPLTQGAMYIFIFGGLARLKNFNKDVVALVSCHELGHGLGGAPYKDSGSSVEGQADYFAISSCFPNIVQMISLEHQDEHRTQELMELEIASKEKRVPVLVGSDIPQGLWKQCLKLHVEESPFACYRALWAIGLYRANLSPKEPRPTFEKLTEELAGRMNENPNGGKTEDLAEEKTEKLDTRDGFYPSNTCRLRTLINGLFHFPRPSCWYKAFSL